MLFGRIDQIGTTGNQQVCQEAVRRHDCRIDPFFLIADLSCQCQGRYLGAAPFIPAVGHVHDPTQRIGMPIASGIGGNCLAKAFNILHNSCITGEEFIMLYQCVNCIGRNSIVSCQIPCGDTIVISTIIGCDLFRDSICTQIHGCLYTLGKIGILSAQGLIAIGQSQIAPGCPIAEVLIGRGTILFVIVTATILGNEIAEITVTFLHIQDKFQHTLNFFEAGIVFVQTIVLCQSHYSTSGIVQASESFLGIANIMITGRQVVSIVRLGIKIHNDHFLAINLNFFAKEVKMLQIQIELAGVFQIELSQIANVLGCELAVPVQIVLGIGRTLGKRFFHSCQIRSIPLAVASIIHRLFTCQSKITQAQSLGACI